MSQMSIGQQYLVTNIKFTHSQYGTIQAGNSSFDEFKIPVTVFEIHDWLSDLDYEKCSDKVAYALYIRSIMFYHFEMSYDLQLIKELPVSNAFQIDYPTFADLADCTYSEYTTAKVDFTIPTAYIATLSAEDIEFADNDIEQAIFENAMRNLPIEINVYSLTDHVLQLLADTMNSVDAPAPTFISEQTYDLVKDLTNNHDLAELVSSGTFELSSYLVKDSGKYW